MMAVHLRLGPGQAGSVQGAPQVSQLAGQVAYDGALGRLQGLRRLCLALPGPQARCVPGCTGLLPELCFLLLHTHPGAGNARRTRSGLPSCCVLASSSDDHESRCNRYSRIGLSFTCSLAASRSAS